MVSGNTFIIGKYSHRAFAFSSSSSGKCRSKANQSVEMCLRLGYVIYTVFDKQQRQEDKVFILLFNFVLYILRDEL
jgi:hypothetical protein